MFEDIQSKRRKIALSSGVTVAMEQEPQVRN